MALLSSRLFPSSIHGVNRFLFEPLLIGAVRNYAARKGTRERKRKQKVKGVKEKVDFLTRIQRMKEKEQKSRQPLIIDDSKRPDPIDNVYVHRYFKIRLYPFIEAVHCHRETHHPEMYNEPNAPLRVNIELNMQGEKKTRFLENFTRIAPMVYPFEHGEERAVLVFSKELKEQEEALNAGASVAGGVQLIREIQNGAVSLKEFHSVVAHPNIMPELIPLRGIIKRKFPNPSNGTLTVDVASAVLKIIGGVTYTAKKDEEEKAYGLIQTTVGNLDMEPEHLEQNFISLVRDVVEHKRKGGADFITACYLLSPPSSEKLKIDFIKYLDQPKNEDDDDEEVVAEVL